MLAGDDPGPDVGISEGSVKTISIRSCIRSLEMKGHVTCRHSTEGSDIDGSNNLGRLIVETHNLTAIE